MPVYPTRSTVYALLRPSATLYLSAISIYRMQQSPHMYVQLYDVVTYYNTVIASDISLTVASSWPLSYFAGLIYTVQSLHSLGLCLQSLVLCPQSSKFCVNPSSACNSSFSPSSSASSPLLPSRSSTSWVPRANLSSPVAGCHRQLVVGMTSLLSISSPTSS